MTEFRRLIGMMRVHRGMMALAIGLSLTAMLANIGLMAISGWFIAAMAMAGVAGTPMNYFTPAAIIRALALSRTASRYAERVVSHDATFHLLASLRRWFYDALEPLAPAHLAAHASGDLLARIRNDIERLELIFLRILAPCVVAAITVAVVTGVFLAYDTAAAFAVLGLLLMAGILLPILAARYGRDPSLSLSARAAEMKDFIVDRVSGLADLSIAGLDRDVASHFAGLSDSQLEGELELAKIRGLSLAGTSLAANAALLAVLGIVIPAVAEARLAAANLPMLMLLAVASFDAVSPLPLAFQSLAGALASARRIFEIADRRPNVLEDPSPAALPPGSSLRFEGVSFRYSDGARRVLSDIDLDIRPGRRIGIVGESGSGKSSLVNLAVRFWDPEAGRITLDGVPLSQLQLGPLRSRIAVSSQKPHFFSGTIRQNLLLAKPDATAEHFDRATRIAAIYDFVQSLPLGYDTYVGAHGHLLSGGELRRLAVAQALLKDAPVLLLDEPTEGLDAATAQQLIDGVLSVSHDRAVVLVTHRATGLASMDEIVVLEASRIVARGPFSDLAAAGGPLEGSANLIPETEA